MVNIWEHMHENGGMGMGWRYIILRRQRYSHGHVGMYLCGTIETRKRLRHGGMGSLSSALYLLLALLQCLLVLPVPTHI